MYFSVACDLPTGDEVVPELSEAEANTLRLDCFYSNPATDRAAILRSMAKTAAARQRWIRTEQPSITEVLGQYPRMEDMPVDMVCATVCVADSLFLWLCYTD